MQEIWRLVQAINKAKLTSRNAFIFSLFELEIEKE